MAKVKGSTQTIEQLRERFDKLNERKIHLQGQRQNEQKRLAELKQQAIEEFGTDGGELFGYIQSSGTEIADKLGTLGEGDLTDKELLDYPFIYIVEPGGLTFRDA